MTLDEIRARLTAALPVREPQFDPRTPPQQKIDELESYLLRTAFHRAELTEAWSWLEEVRKLARRQWDDIVGWEQALPSYGRAREITKERVYQAKRTMRPDLASILEDCAILERDLERQIRRLELDDKVASRAYTFITGS